MEEKDLSYNQKIWLDKHGGRTIEDVRADDDGLYVLFGNKIITKRYLPQRILPWNTQTLMQ